MRPSRKHHHYTSYHREPGGLRRLDFFVDRLEARRQGGGGLTVLDIGCGNGNIALPLAAAGHQVTGLDLDAPSIERARQQAAELGLAAEFQVGSFEAVRGRKFDAIVASEVLEHQADPAGFLRACRGLLKPGGVLLLSVPNGKSLEERIRRLTTHTAFGRKFKAWAKRRIPRLEIQSMHDSPHVQFFARRRLEDLLFEQGYRIRAALTAAVWFKEFYALFGRLWIKRGSPAFHYLDGADEAWARHVPLWLADGWLIEAAAVERKAPLVMQVLPALAGGGAERLAADLAQGLPRLGYETHTVAILGGGPIEATLRKAGAQYRILGVRGFLGLQATSELYKLFRRERPDIVHTHLFGADVWGRVAARLAGVPRIVSTEHNINLDHGWFKTAAKAALASITDKFIAVSGAVAGYMVRHDRIPNGKIQVILNGIDMHKAKPRPSGMFHDVPRLIAVGRLERQKDPLGLLAALAEVKSPWRLQMAGTGSLEDAARRFVETAGIEARVSFLGYREDIPELLAESDLFCFPSRWEGLGLALVEAAAAGVPVVASDLPVLKEVLHDDEATYVPAGDTEAWSQAISRILADPTAAVRRACRAQSRVRRDFALEKMVAAYAELYRGLLDGERREPAAEEAKPTIRT